jgi:fibronectin-binding autotransporter adhesin
LISSTSVYGIANLYYEFLDGARVSLAETGLSTENDRFWGGVGFGGTYSWSGGKYSLYGEGLLKTSLAHPSDSFGVNGTVGLKVSF